MKLEADCFPYKGLIVLSRVELRVRARLKGSAVGAARL
jgi:hypothetical protein